MVFEKKKKKKKKKKDKARRSCAKTENRVREQKVKTESRRRSAVIGFDTNVKRQVAVLLEPESPECAGASAEILQFKCVNETDGRV